MPPRAAVTCLILLGGVVAFTLFLVHRAQSPASPPFKMVAVQIRPVHSPILVSPLAIGVNTAVWDPHLTDPSVPRALTQLGARLLRYPGGTTADVYHWQTNSITTGRKGFAEPTDSFDSWVTSVVRPSRTVAMVTVNYGSALNGVSGGDPAEAAAWVDYANNQKHYGVKYWEIGNEVYGNGYYGNHFQWETDLHSDKSPAAYARNVRLYAHAMKAVDPTVKIGIALPPPGIAPDGRGPQRWTPTVLKRACTATDFISVHWYPQAPGSESDAFLLASAGSIPAMTLTLRKELKHYCGSHAGHVQIMVTETNSVSFNPGKQTSSGVSALFLAEDYLSWLQAGATSVDWWDLHDGPNTHGNLSDSLQGNSAVGDFGLLSNGGTGEPPLNAPFPSFGALHVIAGVFAAHASFAAVSGNPKGLRVYALLRPHWLALVIVNTMPNDVFKLKVGTFHVPGMRSAKVSQFSALDLKTERTSIHVTHSGLSYTVPGYSIAVLTVRTA